MLATGAVGREDPPKDSWIPLFGRARLVTLLGQRLLDVSKTLTLRTESPDHDECFLLGGVTDRPVYLGSIAERESSHVPIIVGPGRVPSVADGDSR